MIIHTIFHFWKIGRGGRIRTSILQGDRAWCATVAQHPDMRNYISCVCRNYLITNNDCDSQIPNRNRRISTPRLKRLLAVHLEPINVIISYGPQTISDLGVGFPLRCFQRLSIPDIAMLRCPWQDNSHTRGQFTPVLSY